MNASDPNPTPGPEGDELREEPLADESRATDSPSPPDETGLSGESAETVDDEEPTPTRTGPLEETPVEEAQE